MSILTRTGAIPARASAEVIKDNGWVPGRRLMDGVVELMHRHALFRHGEVPAHVRPNPEA
jgi:hypothetical protein